MDIEKLKSDEVEQNILGAMLINTESCLSVINSNIKATDFYRSYNQLIFKTIINVFKKQNSVDVVLLLEELKRENLIEKANSISYVTNLIDQCVSTANLESYIELLKEYSLKRKFLSLGAYISTNIDKSIEEITQELTGAILNVIGGGTNLETAEGQEEEYLQILERRIKGDMPLIKTGIFDLDRNIYGFNGGDLVTIFAFSGVGKTTLATNIALNVIKQKKRALFFSLEMPKEQIRDRIISSMTDIPFYKIKYGKFNSKEEEKIIKANSILARNKSLLVLENDELSEITGKIQAEVYKNDVDIIFIDYINLINITGNNKDEHIRVAECTRLLKKLAKKINKPIVILAQGKQEQASKMSNKNLGVWEKVAVNDIAGGSTIFRDSDIVLGMYRNTELDNEIVRKALYLEDPNNIDYNSKDPNKNPSALNILVKKSRASSKDIIAVKWNAKTYKITNWQ